MQKRERVLVHGVTAGLLAATALVLWFLVIDLIAGRTLYTPAFLAGALLGIEQVEIGFALVVGYTLLHYAFFLGFGAAIAWMLNKVGAMASLLLGLVLGVLLFDLMFYTSVLVTGVNVVQALGWPNVLAGNVLAGIALMGYLHLKGVARPVSWLDSLREHQVLREGLVGGLLGAGAVALWFLVFDALSGRIFFTPAALGSALFRSAIGVAAVEITPGIVVAYTLIHVIAFMVVGLVAAAVVLEIEHEPPLLLGAILGFVTFEALFIGLVAIFASWILDTLGWLSIASGNMVATLAMGGYLLRAHPALRRELRELRDHSFETPV